MGRLKRYKKPIYGTIGIGAIAAGVQRYLVNNPDKVVQGTTKAVKYAADQYSKYQDRAELAKIMAPPKSAARLTTDRMEVDKTNPGNAEAEIGYGNHDARRLFSKKRRVGRKVRRKLYNRKKVKRALGKYQKKAVTKKVYRSTHPRAPISESMMITQKEWYHAINEQAFGCYSTGFLFSGISASQEKGNDFHSIMNQNYNIGDYGSSTVLGRFETKGLHKLLYKDCQSKYILFNQGQANLTVHVYDFIFKKSILYNDLTTTSVFSWGDLTNSPPTAVSDFWTAMPPIEKDKDTGHYSPETSSTPGWKPTNGYFAQKYLSCTKVERFEMGAGAKIELNDFVRYNMALNYKTVSSYAALKGVSRIKCFVVRNVPKVASEINYVSDVVPQYGGLIVQQTKTYHWKPIMGILDDMNQATKDKLTSSKSFQTLTEAQNEVRLQIQ